MENYNSIRTEVQTYMGESGKSQKQIAREIAVSPAASPSSLTGSIRVTMQA